MAARARVQLGRRPGALSVAAALDTGHPYAGGRLGTREDVRNLIQYTNDLSAAVKTAADEGKCFDKAMAEIKLPKYEKWGSYAQYLPGNIERFCGYWGRGF